MSRAITVKKYRQQPRPVPSILSSTSLSRHGVISNELHKLDPITTNAFVQNNADGLRAPKLDE